MVGVNGGEWGLMGLICSDIFCKRVEYGGPACCQDLYVGQCGLMEAMWGLNMMKQGLMRAIEIVLIQRKVWELCRKD